MFNLQNGLIASQSNSNAKQIDKNNAQVGTPTAGIQFLSEKRF